MIRRRAAAFDDAEMISMMLPPMPIAHYCFR